MGIPTNTCGKTLKKRGKTLHGKIGFCLFSLSKSRENPTASLGGTPKEALTASYSMLCILSYVCSTYPRCIVNIELSNTKMYNTCNLGGHTVNKLHGLQQEEVAQKDRYLYGTGTGTGTGTVPYSMYCIVQF